jgi:hypothetical protein
MEPPVDFSMKFASSALSCLLFVQFSTAAMYAQVVPKPKMNIVVLEGEGVIHNIKKRAPQDIVVQVRDGNRRPLPGAAVTFTLPAQGASGEFFDRSRILTVTADDRGRAAAKGIRPNTLPGRFGIRVNASHQDETASATVTQFNMVVQGGAGGSGKWIALVAVAGAAAAGGVMAGTRKGNSAGSAGAAAPVPISITPGAGTVGPPR